MRLYIEVAHHHLFAERRPVLPIIFITLALDKPREVIHYGSH